MNFHLTHTGTTSIESRNRKPILAAGLGAVLTVAAITGAAVWTAARETSPSKPTGAPAQAVVTAEPEWLHVTQPTPVYLVSTQEQAAQVQDGLNAAAAYMGPAGAGDAPNGIIAVITSPDQESGLLTAVSGIPDAYLVDMRTP